MKTYYQLLQVDPQAEPEVIEAAYRRLMLKYHPDVLPEEKRNTPEIVQKVQEINEAYEVLHNPEKRKMYDSLIFAAFIQNTTQRPVYLNGSKQPAIEVEKRTYLMRCSKSKRTYRMILARRKGGGEAYAVQGFEPAGDVSEHEPEKNPVSLLRRIGYQLNSQFKMPSGYDQKAMPSLEENLRRLENPEEGLSLGEINFAGYRCPDCASGVRGASGTVFTWTTCGTCHHLCCTGGAKNVMSVIFITCPWCGTTNRISNEVKFGEKGKPLSGDLADKSKQENPKLPGQSPKMLKK